MIRIKRENLFENNFKELEILYNESDTRPNIYKENGNLKALEQEIRKIHRLKFLELSTGKKVYLSIYNPENDKATVEILQFKYFPITFPGTEIFSFYLYKSPQDEISAYNQKILEDKYKNNIQERNKKISFNRIIPLKHNNLENQLDHDIIELKANQNEDKLQEEVKANYIYGSNINYLNDFIKLCKHLQKITEPVVKRRETLKHSSKIF